MQPLVKYTTKKNDSPKTPGGISKALLTPIRRLGLSRNFRKNGPSPFRSPLSGNVVANANSPSPNLVKKNQDNAQEHIEEDSKEPDALEINLTPNENTETIVSTPTRSISLPRKKKSKTALPKPNCDSERLKLEAHPQDKKELIADDDETEEIQGYLEVVTPVKSKSRLSRTKRNSRKIETTISSPVKRVQSVEVEIHNEVLNTSNENSNVANLPLNTPKTIIERTPNELTKECVVVIQKKIFKDELRKVENDKNTQVLFDSDSDEVPLSDLNKEKLRENDDDDFEEPKAKVKKLEDKHTSTSGLKPKSRKKPIKTQPKPNKIDTNIQTSQDILSFDDDDFDFDNKKTILIHKSYAKPHKAKSMGSITQKDIDELSARIEMKKKLLMAKSINKDTEELRELTRKWQKGCQEALAELMDLMKMKFPDRHNMDYSEILETLKIPAALVGYDSDNDCFVTPTNANILLSKLNNI